MFFDDLQTFLIHYTGFQALIGHTRTSDSARSDLWGTRESSPDLQESSQMPGDIPG